MAWVRRRAPDGKQPSVDSKKGEKGMAIGGNKVQAGGVARRARDLRSRDLYLTFRYWSFICTHVLLLQSNKMNSALKT